MFQIEASNQKKRIRKRSIISE